MRPTFSRLALFALITTACFAAGLPGFGFALLLAAAVIALALLAIWADSRPLRSLRGVFVVMSFLCVLLATIQLPPWASASTAFGLTLGALTLWAVRQGRERKS